MVVSSLVFYALDSLLWTAIAMYDYLAFCRASAGSKIGGFLLHGADFHWRFLPDSRLFVRAMVTISEDEMRFFSHLRVSYAIFVTGRWLMCESFRCSLLL